MINRRQFLIATAAALGSACASKVPLLSGGGKPPEHVPPVDLGPVPDALRGVPVGGTSVLTPKGSVYMIPTPHIYFGKDNDLLG